MEGQPLVFSNLITTRLLTTPVTAADLTTESQENHQQTSSNLLALSDAAIPIQKSTNDTSSGVSIEPLLLNNGEGAWVNNQLQYVVIRKGEQETIAQVTHNTTPTSQNQTYKCLDKLQCGICGKIQTTVMLFLHHKSSHVARGMGLGCEICGLSFSRQLALTEHYRRKHRILLNEKKHTREPNRPVRTHKNVPQSSTLSLLAQHTLQTDYNTDVFTENVISKQSIPLTENNSQNDMFLAESIESISKIGEECMETTPSNIDSEASGNMIEENVTTLVEDKKDLSTFEIHRHLDPSCTQTSTSQNNYRYNEHENTLQVSNEKLSYDSRVTYSATPHIESKVDIIQDEARHEDHPDLTIESTCEIDTIEAAPIVVIRTKELVETVNSDSSEKENCGDDCEDPNPDSDMNNPNDITLDQSLSISNKSKSLTNELNMPDFHFLPVIEKKPSRSVIQGGRYSFKCLYCDVKVSWRSSMCKHMREKHPDILKVGTLLNIPDKINGNDDVMKMSEYMKMEIKPSGKRIRGVETQDLPGEFLCDKCDKIFYRLRYLRKHQAVHKAEKNLLCSVCVKSFKTIGNLKQHMRTHRNREAYKCGECDFESTVNIAIHAHRQIHCKGCVLCEVCGSAYIDKSTLTKHKEVHNPMRPFACDFPGCTWRFKTKTMCNAHFRTHTTKGAFECSICGYAFRQKHHLQRHEKKVHNIIEERKPAYSYLEPTVLTYTREEDEPITVEQSDTSQEVNLVVNEGHEVSVDTVVEEQFDLENALQSGHLVIATEDGSTINCEMSDIGMNMSYQTLLPDGDTGQLDSHTILIPQTDGSHIVYQHEQVAETVSSTEETETTKVE